MIGYEGRMADMFHNANPGLSRRFPVCRPFRFRNFNIPQLMSILEKKMPEQNLKASPGALETAGGIFERASMRPDFSNAGEVDKILSTAKINYQARQAAKPFEDQNLDHWLEPLDFDQDYELKVTTDGIDVIRERLKGTVHDSIIEKLVKYQTRCLAARKVGLNPTGQVPTKFVFKGFEGTGKTTTAKYMGEIFYKMGFLTTPDVIECSATDLIGSYSPLNRRNMATPLHRRRVRNRGDQRNPTLSLQPAHDGKIVVILTGPEQAMKNLMRFAPPLAGLFHQEILFNHLEPADCITLLHRELSDRGFTTEDNLLQNPKSQHYIIASRLFKVLQVIPGWSNARDVKHLANQIIIKFLDGSANLSAQIATAKEVQDSIFEVINQRRQRYMVKGAADSTGNPLTPPESPGLALGDAVATASASSSKTAINIGTDSSATGSPGEHDPGDSDSNTNGQTPTP
ncbi:hypothetical protein QBC38DRAFT_524416 [Podospora fimiseda]|uniref:CbbX AAA lid domain-containing protein n=1 Tax=Podospora fimiseda TaxID=252190 RepID=A0AAN6YLH0_9PEZI|nr:hypothetical protein QBC38DRAFT_524416 [Podospora fimiseda]